MLGLRCDLHPAVWTQSFAGISRASEQTLLDLPGLAQTKVRRLRDTFHKPFHNRSTAVFPSFPRKNQPLSSTETSSKDNTTEERPEGRDVDVASSVIRPRASPMVRSPSTVPVPKPRPPRSPSPVWDIELDLNDFPSPPSDGLDNLPAKKKHKADYTFGNPFIRD